jgi:ribosomal protein S18 acetylase RimI-like enzyme
VAAAALASDGLFSGLRPVDLRIDLAGIAELLELCFGPTMDEAGRAAIREYRWVSQSGSLMFLFAGLNRLLGGLEQGFVWIEEDRLVGNVSVSPANFPRSLGVGHVIANVAVHPDYRRRGLAQAMLTASLDLIRRQGGDFAVLQVDTTNDVARRLYTRLGFREERTFTRWQRSSYLRPPQLLRSTPDVTLRQPHEWRSEYELALLARPNEKGGLGWLRPTHPDRFRPSLWQGLTGWMIGSSEDHWVIRDERDQKIVASLRVNTSFGAADRLELLVHPAYQGQLEEPLINYVLRRLDGYRHPLTMEHPADDQVTTSLLERYSFENRNKHVHMRYDL